MARLSLVARTVLYLIIRVGTSLAIEYGDNSDYGDYLDYDVLLPEKRSAATAAGALAAVATVLHSTANDFYIAGEEAEDRARRVAGPRETESEPLHAEKEEEEMGVEDGGWPSAERVYRYTKHRIPGYDYDELEFLEARRGRRCDERSVWTHCLCQFTCAEPSIVDCYTPCTSGCECREDYVYDERTGLCVHLEQCQPDEDYMLY